MAETTPSCFHCGLPAADTFSGTIQGEPKSFCCPGCRALALLIHDSGLADFYQYREALPLKRPAVAKGFDNPDSRIKSQKQINNQSHIQESMDFSIYDDPAYQSDFVRQINPSISAARLQLYGMNCSACAWLIEKRLEKVHGVQLARVNYSQRTLSMEWNNKQASLSTLMGELFALGFEFEPAKSHVHEEHNKAEEQAFLKRIGVAGIGMMQVGMYAMAGYLGAEDTTLGVLQFASLIIATLVIFYAARPFFVGAWRALSHQYLSMDVPVALALGLAYGASLFATWASTPESLAQGVSHGHGDVYFDAICMFSFFLLLSRYFEFKARSRWYQQQLGPKNDGLAHLIDEQGNTRQIADKTLVPGQKILVKTGEHFPVDVCLDSRQAEISQAQLSGEFAPMQKGQKETISSGSINLGQPVEAWVLKPLNESTLSQVQWLVNQAQLHKPRISSLADQISGYFVAAVLLMAFATYLVWLQQAPSQAFWVALSVLVVSCPCALSLATPTTLTALMHDLQSRGILVQNPAALEKLEKVNQVIFDKTGTLTRGEFQVEWSRDLTGEGMAVHLQRARALERNSNHPIAKAFHHFANESSQTPLICQQWRQIQNGDHGRGIEAQVSGPELSSTKMRIGDADFIRAFTTDTTYLAQFDDQARKLIFLADRKNVLAVFALSDSLREEAGQMLGQLRQQLPSAEISILSGDQSTQVARVARQLEITKAYQDMDAEDKMRAIHCLQKQGKLVMAVGDGVNDAPLLARADISIAVSNAVDLSKQKADFILLSNNLLSITELLAGARRGKRIVVQNLAWALTYNLSAIPLAMMGMVPPWLAAIGMSLSSALVVLNALRARCPQRRNGRTASVQGKQSSAGQGAEVLLSC